MMVHRHILRSVCAFFFCFSIHLVNSQDIHFTLHHMTPLAFNPANTGSFYGSFRLSGLYRDQYRSVAGNGAFSTPTFSVDAPVIKGFKEKDWVGVGLFFYSDRSGTIGLTQQTFKVSAAYHLALNKNGTRVFSFAYQTGPVQRFVKNRDGAIFEDELIANSGANTSADYGLLMDKDKKGYLDHVGGLKFSSKYNKTDEFSFGLAAARFGTPDWSILGPSMDTTVGVSGTYEVDPRVYAHAGMSTLMSDKVRFLPSITYQKILNSAANTLVVQGHIDYLYNEAKQTVLKAGIGYRSGQGIGDAIQLMAGAEIKGINFMLGYDINVSRLSVASNASGGFELSAQYIGKVFKRPNPDPIIFCPRF
ncbi:MAG: PorP/SprF family type IX secretion system membrane protein [Saprospiraceae bacterium]